MTVRLERPAPFVAEIVLHRPEALNAMSTAQCGRLSAVCAEVAADPAVRVVVLTSSSLRAFCAGADLKERNSFTDDQLRAHRPVSRAAYRAVLDLPMVAVAAVEGYALGGGCELALACDLVVASDSAVFGLPEVRVGLIPGGGGTQVLSRRIGLNRALDLVLTGRRLDADEAFRLGLADRRCAAGSARQTALELAEQIGANSPVGVRAAKRAVRQGFEVGLARGLELEDQGWERAAFSPDRVEGIAAFNEGRRPQW